MKKLQIFATAALLSLGIISCQKEETGLTHFTAGMEKVGGQQSKTVLGDGNYIEWVGGDQVLLFDGTGVTVYRATPNADDATWAEFNPVQGPAAAAATRQPHRNHSHKQHQRTVLGR